MTLQTFKVDITFANSRTLTFSARVSSIEKAAQNVLNKQNLWNPTGGVFEIISIDVKQDPSRVSAVRSMIWELNDFAAAEEYDDCYICGSLDTAIADVEATDGGHVLVPFGLGDVSDSGYMGCWGLCAECADDVPERFYRVR